MVPDISDIFDTHISDTPYLLYPIFMIPNISDILIYSLSLTRATTMPRAVFFPTFLMLEVGKHFLSTLFVA